MGAGNLIIQGKMIILTPALHYMDGSVVLINEGQATWLDGVLAPIFPPLPIRFIISKDTA
jgi:hypothetical protein